MCMGWKPARRKSLFVVLLTLIAVAAVLAALAGSVLAVAAIVRHGERSLTVYGGLALSILILLLLLHPLFISD